MPASRVTSRRLSWEKLRSSRSLSAAATIARRVASLRSSRDMYSRGRDSREWERPDRADRSALEVERLLTANSVQPFTHDFGNLAARRLFPQRIDLRKVRWA